MYRHRLRLTLVGSDPEIWRVFDVRGSLTLGRLHMAIQVLMGWRESHLHAFADADPHPPLDADSRSRGQARRRWEPPALPDADSDALSENDYALDDVLSTTDRLWYEYDFGDSWVHLLDVIDRMPDEQRLAPVVLVDGANRGPFEDAGGVRGYAEKLQIAADPQHPEHSEIVDWIRTTVGPWAPAEPGMFDLVAVQSELNLLFTPGDAGVDPYDMAGLVKAEGLRSPGDVGEASPIVALTAQLPPPIRAELRQHLHAADVLEPHEIDDDTAAQCIRPFLWLVDAVGRDGLALTTDGRLPPDVVLAGMTELGWIDGWIGKANREDLTPPIAELRQAAQRLGLVRTHEGRLVLSTAAQEALGDPQRMLRMIVDGLFGKLSDAEADAATLLLLSIADGTPSAERWRTIAFGLDVCGWRSASGRRFSAADIDHVTFQTTEVLDLIAAGDRGAGDRGGGDRGVAAGDPGRAGDLDGPLVALFAREALR